MKDVYSVDTKVRRTRIALYLMLASFVMGMIVAVGSLVSMSGVLDTDAMGNSTLGVPTILISLLTPWAIIFEVVAVVLILLVFGIALPRTRKLLWVALVLTVVGNFATVILGGTAMELRAVETSGAISYVPKLVVDYTKGLYPVLLTLGYAGGLAYIVAYVSLVTRMDIDLHDVAGSS